MPPNKIWTSEKCPPSDVIWTAVQASTLLNMDCVMWLMKFKIFLWLWYMLFKECLNLIMAMKQKCLGLNTKLEVICLCKASSSSKIGTGRQYRWTSPMFTHPETKDEISSVIHTEWWTNDQGRSQPFSRIFKDQEMSVLQGQLKSFKQKNSKGIFVAFRTSLWHGPHTS